MPTMPPEEEAQLRQKVADLTGVYNQYCVYRYSQSAELKKLWKYKKSKGVCMAMSTDWLRRKLFNINNPLAKQKRNFNDVKYNTTDARKHLTTKHAKMHDVYKARHVGVGVGGGTQGDINAMAATNIVNAGMTNLRANTRWQVWGYELQQSPNPHIKGATEIKNAIDGVRQQVAIDGAAGLIIHMQGESGHAVGVYADAAGITFFDPNLGEYFFPSPNVQPTFIVTFISLIWHDIYYRFFQMNNIEIDLVRYQ